MPPNLRAKAACAYGRRIAFQRIAAKAARRALDFVPLWLPRGRKKGRVWVARNHMRSKRTPESFKVNLHTGKWNDFTTGNGGRDLISLASYLYGLTPPSAALRVAAMLGMDPYES
ncbi:hypothetical protein FZC33_15975 [Labrys sp. KNU-23]|nr:hypothetical protein FZC33_15975 [Labrys sp. KNU-23]